MNNTFNNSINTVNLNSKFTTMKAKKNKVNKISLNDLASLNIELAPVVEEVIQEPQQMPVEIDVTTNDCSVKEDNPIIIKEIKPIIKIEPRGYINLVEEFVLPNPYISYEEHCKGLLDEWQAECDRWHSECEDEVEEDWSAEILEVYIDSFNEVGQVLPAEYFVTYPRDKWKHNLVIKQKDYKVKLSCVKTKTGRQFAPSWYLSTKPSLPKYDSKDYILRIVNQFIQEQEPNQDVSLPMFDWYSHNTIQWWALYDTTEELVGNTTSIKEGWYYKLISWDDELIVTRTWTRKENISYSSSSSDNDVIWGSMWDRD